MIEADQQIILDVVGSTAHSPLPIAFDTLNGSHRGEIIEKASAIPKNAKVVVTSLLSDIYDAYEVLSDLRDAKFKGRVIVHASGIPNLDLVKDDLSQVAGELAFEIIDLTAPPTHLQH